MSLPGPAAHRGKSGDRFERRLVDGRPHTAGRADKLLPPRAAAVTNDHWALAAKSVSRLYVMCQMGDVT